MPSHRVQEEWMGEEVTTLEDLLRPGLRAVCVGINPSLVSVEAGHYYQGRLGQGFYARLRAAGVLPASLDGYEDDAAFDAGHRLHRHRQAPNPEREGRTAGRVDAWCELLEAKLIEHKPELVIFTFKKTAQTLFGPFAGNGFVPGLALAHSEVFVMPGPYESAGTAEATMRQLAARFEGA